MKLDASFFRYEERHLIEWEMAGKKMRPIKLIYYHHIVVIIVFQQNQPNEVRTC
jgi:hypothetical protein